MPPAFKQPGVPTATVRAVLVPLTLLVLAASLWFGGAPFTSPVTPATRVPPSSVDPAPVRQPRLRPEIQLAGFQYRCSDCHKLFVSPAETDRPLTQHREIQLEHGLNTRCFNCHHRTNRDAFVDDAGGEIPYDQPQQLCARCHGPVFRDWERGVHGRTNGHWDPRRGPVQRLRCIQCHDPHHPPFAPLPPAPGPATLRMGDQSVPPHGDEQNPLRIDRQRHEETR